jgi:hypothetical protein
LSAFITNSSGHPDPDSEWIPEFQPKLLTGKLDPGLMLWLHISIFFLKKQQLLHNVVIWSFFDEKIKQLMHNVVIWSIFCWKNTAIVTQYCETINIFAEKYSNLYAIMWFFHFFGKIQQLIRYGMILSFLKRKNRHWTQHKSRYWYAEIHMI